MTTLQASPDSKWIQTYTGRAFWPLDPNPAHVCIEDIAHALAMKCRYTGHCLMFYSVAQHAVLVSHIVPPEDALWGLMHDASEAYLPDVARPVKRNIPGFSGIEDRVMEAIATHFGMSWPMPESIKHADLVMLATERRDLMASPPFQWVSTENIEPMADEIGALYPMASKSLFLSRWRELTAPAAPCSTETH
jgi:5'-deoxynucleotidase YfbR-like HD superfamily hydrolase